MVDTDPQIKSRAVNWWVVVILLLVFTGLGWLLSAVTTYMMPKLYQSRAVVELIPQGDTVTSWGVDAFVDTEIEVIKGQENLRLVVDKLQLETRWGVYSDDAAKRVAQQMKVRRLNASRAVEIKFTHRMKEEAQAVAQGIYESYKERRYQLYAGSLKDKAKAVRVMMQNQSDRVAELRKRYMDVTEKVGGFYERKYGDELDLDRFRAQQEVNISKDEYLAAKTRLHALEKEYGDLRKKLQMPPQMMLVHEVPTISNEPVSPDIPRNLSRGVIAGFLFGCLLAALYCLGKKCA